MLVIFDIDNTLADASPRLVHIKGPGKKNWQKFYEGIENDRLIEPVAAVYRLLRAVGHQIIIISGRNVRDAEPETSGWLARHGLKHDGLFLRPATDYRPDGEFKRALLETVIIPRFGMPDLAFEDSPRVIAEYRARGIFVVDCGQDPHDESIATMTFEPRR